MDKEEIHLPVKKACEVQFAKADEWGITSSTPKKPQTPTRPFTQVQWSYLLVSWPLSEYEVGACHTLKAATSEDCKMRES